MTGKHRDGEQNPLEQAQVSEEEVKVVSKCECLALKSPSACEGMEGPGEPHPVTQQTTAVDGISHVDCTRSPDREKILCSSRLRGDLGNNNSTSHRSPGCESMRDDSEKHR